jgi:hypothetical protein
MLIKGDQFSEHKVRSILIETEDLHQIYDDMKLSEAERKSAVDDAKKECERAYNDVLERHKYVAHQICSSELKCKRLCDVLGEKDITNADIQVSNVLCVLRENRICFYHLRVLFFSLSQL